MFVLFQRSKDSKADGAKRERFSEIEGEGGGQTFTSFNFEERKSLRFIVGVRHSTNGCNEVD